MQESSEDSDGPPMVPHESNASRTLKHKRREVLKEDIQWKKSYKPRAFRDLQGADHMIASELPEGFPDDLAFRALAAYAFLRTLSRELRLSPFTPNVFLRALNLPYPSRLIGRVHVALLRHLLPSLGYTYRPRGMSLAKKRKVDGLRWDLRAGDNLSYLDSYTWPVFYDDYVHLTADSLYERLHDNTSHLDYRALALQDENGDYIPSDPEGADDEEKMDAVNVTASRARGRGFGLPIRKGRGMPMDRTQMQDATRPNLKSTTPPFQPPLAKRKLDEAVDSNSDASFQSDDTDTEDEDFNAPRSRGKGTGRRGRPRKRPHLPLNKPAGQSARPNSHTPGKALNSQLRISENVRAPFPSPHMTLQRVVTVPSTYTGPGTIPTMAPPSSTHFSQTHPSTPGPGRLWSSNHQSVARPTPDPASGEQSKMTRLANGNHGYNARTVPPHMVDLHLSGPTQIPVVCSPWAPKIDSTPQRGMAMPGLPFAGAMQIPYQPSAAWLGGAVSESATAGRLGMQLPRPWMRRPLMTQLPRPGMPSILPVMPPRPKVNAPSAPKIRLEKMKPKGLCVSDAVADSLESFLHGSTNRDPPKGSQAVNDASPASANSVSESPFDPWRSDATRNEWPQFTPLKTMRKGVPHHRLPISQKIQVLEYLIDELLTVDYIAAEFTRRQYLTSCYTNRFGSLPTKQELDELENDDECGVCGLEGDLLCCDGCPSSYHKECVGMHEMSQLPEGTWMCPECQVIDPALYGSLKGGRKASVDWFCVKDLQTASRAESGQHVTSQADFHDKYSLNPSNAVLLSNDGSEKSTNDGAAREDNEEDSLMIVHGFVVRKRNFLSGLDLLNASRTESLSYNIVKPAELFPFIQQLGMTLVSRWPLAQIPVDSSKVWNCSSSQPAVKSIAAFFAAELSFDPSKYQSVYNLAPLPNVLSAIAPVKDPALVTRDYEHFCYHADTKTLSLHLTQDVSNDKALSYALRCETTLFSPYSMIAGYLEKLEGALSRAGLLSELWSHRTEESGRATWIQKVAHCRSVNRLAKLLVTLVDAVHPLAFNDDWFQSPIARSGRAARDDISGDDKRVYRSLPVDWSASKEKETRRWEQCTESNILSLLAADSKCLAEFVDGNRLRSRLIGRKRKGAKSSSMLSEHSSDAAHPSPDAKESTSLDCGSKAVYESMITSRHDGQMLQGSQESTNAAPDIVSKHLPCLNTEAVSEDTSPADITSQEDAARSRRSRRQAHGNDGVNGKQVGIGIDGTLNQVKASKIKDFVAMLAHPIEKEIHWPVCGRCFFDPVAYIAPSEMRRLGRNAGTVVAPYVTYSKTYEVGQGGACHIWRKRCLDCVSLECLILQIRTLRSFLEDDVIFSCETAMRRYGGNKSSLQKSIVSSLRDLSTGELNYFVYHQGRHRGCWFPASKIDAASYVVEREKRRAKIQAERLRKALAEKMRLQARAEKERLQAQTEKIRLQAISNEEEMRLQAIANEKELAERAAAAAAALVKKTKLVTAAARPREHANVATKKRVRSAGATKSLIAVQSVVDDSFGKRAGIAASASSLAGNGPYIQSAIAPYPQNHVTNRQREVQKCRSDLEVILLKHKADTGRLLLECMSSGAGSIPDQAMFNLRSRHLAQLRSVNAQIGRLAGSNLSLSDERLKALMIDTEGLARRSFESAVAASRDGNRGGFGHQGVPQPQSHYSASYQHKPSHAYESQHHTQAQAAPASHAPFIGHNDQGHYPEQDWLAHHAHLNPESSTGTTPYSNPMGASFLSEAMHEPGMTHSQPAFAPQTYDMSMYNPYGLFGQELPRGVHVNDPTQILQSHSLQPQNQHLYQLAHGQDLSQVTPQQQQRHQQQQQQQQQHRHFERRTESEFEPRPLEEMPPQYPRQWK